MACFTPRLDRRIETPDTLPGWRGTYSGREGERDAR